MEPVDLLDSGTARSLTRRAAGQHTADEEIDDFARDLGGRMVINKVCDLTLVPCIVPAPLSHWANCF